MLTNNVDNFKLGSWKLEYKIDKATFMAPKTYCYTKEDGKTQTKGKGIPNRLLLPEHFSRKEEEIKIDKMFHRSLKDGIHINPTQRTIQPVLTKRKWTNLNESEAFETLDERKQYLEAIEKYEKNNKNHIKQIMKIDL
jgi:hypothetical protein